MKELTMNLTKQFNTYQTVYDTQRKELAFCKYKGRDESTLWYDDGDGKNIMNDNILGVDTKFNIVEQPIVETLSDELIYSAEDINTLFENENELKEYILKLHVQISRYKNIMEHGSVYGEASDTQELEPNNEKESVGLNLTSKDTIDAITEQYIQFTKEKSIKGKLSHDWVKSVSL